MPLKKVFTAEQVEEFRDAFLLFETEGEGTVCNKEVGVVVRCLSLNPPEDELNKAIDEVDPEGLGCIDFHQFMKIMHKLPKEIPTEDEVIAAFKIFDKKGDGFILKTDLRHVLTTLADKLSEEEVEKMMNAAQCDVEGNIDYTEFAKMIMEPSLF